MLEFSRWWFLLSSKLNNKSLIQKACLWSFYEWLKTDLFPSSLTGGFPAQQPRLSALSTHSFCSGECLFIDQREGKCESAPSGIPHESYYWLHCCLHTQLSSTSYKHSLLIHWFNSCHPASCLSFSINSVGFCACFSSAGKFFHHIII